MKKISAFTAVFLFAFIPVWAQDNSIARAIDSLLIREDYKKVVDTCRQILSYDSLNPAIHYKMGIAYQNILEEKNAVKCFFSAAELDTANPVYSFKLAKSYYAGDKMKLAEPLFVKLCRQDTLNWIYSFYLTSIYMQSGRYDEALKIYNRFLQSDSTNCTYLDKTAFVHLRKKNFEDAISLFNKSLSIEGKNIPAIKNLSYLYASTSRWDTAVAILGAGMKIDPTDMDLYVRRAQLLYSRNYTKRAMDDYLVILASGDSSKPYLKRVGIGYSYNLQPEKAIPYLLLAHQGDTTDYETCSYLAQCYGGTGDSKRSVLYYKKAVKILLPLHIQLGKTYFLIAQSLQGPGLIKEAIDYYNKAYEIDHNISVLMIIANLYDEALNDRQNAIKYYRIFLEREKGSKMSYPPEYIDKVKKRLEYLEKQKANPIGLINCNDRFSVGFSASVKIG
jgi:tetratricopeptide (TPR) repeat protein